MNAIRRTATVMAGLVLTVMLGGCGSGHPTTMTSPTPPPPPPTTRSVIQARSGSLPARTFVRNVFTTPSSGTLDITVDWTVASSPIGVYVARQACAVDDFNAGACNFVTISETSQKPRKITLPGFGAGTYELLIANFATVDESASYEIGLTTGAGAASVATERSGARDPRMGGALSSAASF